MRGFAIATVVISMGLLAPTVADARKGGRGMKMMQAYGRGGGGPGMGMGRRGPGGKGRGMGAFFHPALIEEVAGEIGVSDATLAKIKDLIYKANKAHIDQRAQVDQARLVLHELMNEERPNQSKVLAQVERVGELETEGHKNRIKLLLDVRALLTPEQRQKLREVIASRRGPGPGYGPGRGRGPGPGPGPGRGPCGGAGPGPWAP